MKAHSLLIVCTLLSAITANAAELHQSMLVRTNRNVAIAGRPAADAQIDPTITISGKELPTPFGKLHIVLALNKTPAGLNVFCGGNGFREASEGAAAVETFSRYGDVLLFDYPGLGMSDGTGSKEEYLATIEALSSEIAHLGTSHPQVRFWGHSLGGSICAALAAHYAGPSNLILAGAFADIETVSHAIITRNIAMARLLNIHIAPDVLDIQIPKLLTPYKGNIAVIASRADQTIPYSVTAALADALVTSGKKVIFLPLDGTAHGTLMSSDVLGKLPQTITGAPASYISQRHTPSDCPYNAREGCGRLIWPDGTHYIGAFHDGLPDGPGTLTHRNGTSLMLTYHNGTGAGVATLTRPGIPRMTGKFSEITSSDKKNPDGNAVDTQSLIPRNFHALLLVYALITEDGEISQPIVQLPPSLPADAVLRSMAGLEQNLKKKHFHPAQIGDAPVMAIQIFPYFPNRANE